MSATALSACAGNGSAVGVTVAAALQFFAASQCLVQEPWPPHPTLNNGSCFNFIIVGAGTAGSVVATRLSEVANFTVLLVEAGGNPPQESIIPGFRSSLKGSQYDWNFTTVNDNFSSQALRGGSQRQPRGKMLGGSGSNNDMIYARGFPADYNEWASIVGVEWKWENVLEYFKKTEHLTDERIINDPELMKYHGRGGEIEIAGLNESTFDTDRFIEAFKELGFNSVKDMTFPDFIGVGRFSHTLKDGRRDSSLTALLNKATQRDNLFVLKNTLVTKILMRGKTAFGVKVLSNDEELYFYASNEVILSAGTFNTPKLLLLSGIGPQKYLENMNIEVVKDLPVGDNLHDHIMVLNYLAANNGTCQTDLSTTHMNMIQYLYDHTGPLSKTNSMGAYLSLKGSLEPKVPDIAFYPTCMPIKSQFYEPCIGLLGLDENICLQLDTLNKEKELMSIAIVLLKPKSRGKVKLNSINPIDQPLIYSGTFNNIEDLDSYPEAINIVKYLAETSYFKTKEAQVIDFKIDMCNELKGSEELKCKAKAMAMSAWHAVGTAAMGTVVDARLRVNGVSSLRVVDASIMPKVIRGNTNAPVIMIAEKAADFIKEEFAMHFNI